MFYIDVLRNLSSLVQDNLLDCALADRAEALSGVIAHTADIRRTVDALREVAATFVKTYGVVGCALWSHGSWYLDAVREHICPLRVEVYQGGDIWLPWLMVERVHIVIIVVVIVEVLVTKACE